MVQILVLQDGGMPIVESEEDLQKFLESDRFIHYAGMLMPYRPGVMECISVLEHKHYQPGTERNELYILRNIFWQSMVFVLVSIPFEEKQLMEKVASQCGLRISDGVPTAIMAEGMDYFPANNDRVFTLEFQAGHAGYRNDPKINDQLLRAELETVSKIQEKKLKKDGER